MKKQTQDRLEEIIKLQDIIKNAENKLEQLLTPEPIIAPPIGFSYTDEVLNTIKGYTETGVSRIEILKKLKETYPDYGKNISKKQIASALAYLKNSKKEIEIVKRGVYRYIKQV